MSDETYQFKIGVAVRLAELLLIAEEWFMGECEANAAFPEFAWNDPGATSAAALVGDLTKERGYIAHADKTQAMVVLEADQLFVNLLHKFDGAPMGKVYELAIRLTMIELVALFEGVVRDHADPILTQTGRLAFEWNEDLHRLYDAGVPFEDREKIIDRFVRMVTYVAPAQVRPDDRIVRPSEPMTLVEAASRWGGKMTPKSLAKLVDDGIVPARRLTRQKWVFCLSYAPQLAKPATPNSAA